MSPLRSRYCSIALANSSMWLWWILPLVMAVAKCHNQTSTGFADVLSNYAKVAVNQFLPKTTETTPIVSNTSVTASEDDASSEDYEDFDDMAATEQPKATNMDGQSMMKYISGLVNLMALMAQYSDKPKRETANKRKRVPASARNSEPDPLAGRINGLAIAQERYNPTTATKKFKLSQGGYPPLAASPVYVPPASSVPADSYASSGGKTSYDSDASEYMVSNDMNNPTSGNSMKRPKPVMKDYMSQNEPSVDVQQSYSYQLPSETVKAKPMDMKPSYSYAPPEALMKKPPMKISPWNSIEMSKPQDDHDEQDEKPLGPVYYPWNMKAKQPPQADYESDDDIMETHPKSPDHDNHYPWKHSPKKAKPAPADYEEAPVPWGMRNPPRKPLKELGPEEEDSPDAAPEWHSKHKPGDDHVYPYPVYHDHGLLYPGDDDHHHNDDHEEDHDMKDEDRESKRPYTYYHLGRKLWYVPLLFSLYFIVYIGALLLKSIARHKVQFPEKLWEIHDHHGHDRNGRNLDAVTANVLTTISKAENKLM